MEDWEVHTHGGKRPTGKRATTWAVEVEDLGAGEILLTSIGRDGMKDGYDLKMISALVNKISIPPVIASGGGRNAGAFCRGSEEGAVPMLFWRHRSSTTVFFSVREVKEYLQHQGIEVFL